MCAALRRARSVVTATVIAATVLACAAGSTAWSQQIIAYVFPGDAPVAPQELSAAELTRINYAFVLIRNGVLVPGSPNDAQNLATLRTVRQQHPGLKLLASVGGWAGSDQFSDTALTPKTRARFVESVMAFLQKNDLDGLDVDWEYPGMAGATNHFRPADKQNYTLLLQALRTRFDQFETRTHRHLLLSVAAGGGSDFLDHTQMGVVQRSLDTVNLMAYDYYEPSSDTTTGNHAPLFTDPRDPKGISANRSVKLFEVAGVPAAKIVLGVPFYGHVWTHVPPANHGLFQPGKALAQDYAPYSLIVSTMLGHGFERSWNEAGGVPTLYNPATRTFVSYEDPESLAKKGEYIRAQGLGGVMFWDSEGDPSGVLLHTLHQSFHESAHP